MSVSLIAAMTHSGVIGRQNQLPWNIPEELQYFKSMTVGKTVVMGRKTFESIGRPLPKRRNLILTQQQDFNPEGCEVCHSVEAVVDCVRDEEELMVIGGAQVYQAFLPIATRVYRSLIAGDYTGDTYFPELDSSWRVVSEVDRGLFLAQILERS